MEIFDVIPVKSFLTLILVFGVVALVKWLDVSVFGFGRRPRSRAFEEKDFPDRPGASENFSYHAKAQLLTFAEIEFYRALQGFLKDKGLRVFAQVRIADLLIPRTRDYAEFNRIAQKHVDFVAVDSNFRIRFAVELDDRSHGRADRIKRDRFVDDAFASARLPLLRFDEEWTPELISDSIFPILKMIC